MTMTRPGVPRPPAPATTRTASNDPPELERRVWSQDRREAAVLAIIVAGGLAVIWLWWRDTPATSLRSLGDRLTAAGRVTGLVGTYLVLVQVVLMARMPWLDRLIGSDRLSVWHRSNGAYTIILLVAHAALTIWGYSGSDHFTIAHETNVVIRSYPDMLTATAGLAVLVVVGFASARVARRHLKYETWYFIHLYTYLAIALSFSHQLATGNDFVNHPGNRLLWIGLYVLTGVLLVANRIVMPVRSTLYHRMRVAVVVPEGPDAVSVYITGWHLDLLPTESGQFFRWRFLARDGWWQAHPFSLSAAPNRRFLRITAKGVGDHSAELARLAPGTPVIAEGPFGSLTGRRRTRPKVLLVAGGVGITPVRALLEELPAAPGDLTLLYRAHAEADLLLRSELEELAETRGIRVHYLLGRRDEDPRPLSAGVLASHVPDVGDHDIYLCGPPGMMDEAARSLRKLGARRAQIHREHFEL
ncbi:MAG: ferredoxin reductase family protein [Acidimicrobiales bacterium]